MPPIRAAARARARPPTRAPVRPARRISAAERKRRRNAMVLAGVLAFSLLAILGVLYQLFLAGESSPAPPRPAFAIPANARRFSSLADFERAGRPTAGIPFAITITEPELNARLQAELGKQGDQIPFRGVKARVLDDRVEFTGQASAAGLELPSTVEIRFFARNGGIGYEIESISFGPVPVPGVARQALADAIDRQLSGQKLSDQWLLDDVQARVGALTLVGHPK